MKEMTLQESFEAFHQENPHVYEGLRKLALRAVRSGKKKVGIKMLFEVLRWERYFETSDEDFKLNNNYHSRYSRLLSEREPELKEAFEMRGLKS